MLKIGYALMLLAGACAVGFVGYHVIRVLVTAPGIHPFFKAVILLGGVGVVLVLIGLVRERRREDKDASSHDATG